MSKPNFDENSLITAEIIAKSEGVPVAGPDEFELQIRKAELMLILQVAEQAFVDKHAAADIVERLAGELHVLRNSVEPSVWKQLIPIAQGHPVCEFLHQDPFTGWSFRKPRGYSGDASLLDIYYMHPAGMEIVDQSTDLGREIFAYTSEAASSKAGRERRRILAETADNTIRRVNGAELISIASGHLRETELSELVGSDRLKRWVGLDQDPISVAIANEANHGNAVRAVEGSVRDILRRSHDLGTFDLVYVSGLYDYLPRKIGIKLMQRLLELLNPGGELLFANFSDEITTDGYMETFMDWPLILRSADDMWDIINASVDRNQVDADVFYGSNRNVVYGKFQLLQ